MSLSWPWAAASQVLPAWLDWAPHAPDPLWSNLVLQTLPDRPGPTVHVGVVWSGTPSDLTPLLRGLDTAAGSSGATQYNETTSFAHAMLVEAGCSTLNAASCRLQTQGGSLPRTPTLAKSDYLDRPLNDAGGGCLPGRHRPPPFRRNHGGAGLRCLRRCDQPGGGRRHRVRAPVITGDGAIQRRLRPRHLNDAGRRPGVPRPVVRHPPSPRERSCLGKTISTPG